MLKPTSVSRSISADGFDGKAAEYAAKAIELDPKLAEAHELMADLALANDDREAAAAEADKAIALEDDALDAMAIHAAVELLADRSPDAWFGKDSRRSIPATARPTPAWRTSLSCTIATKMRSPTTARRSKPIRSSGPRTPRSASISCAWARKTSRYKELELSLQQWLSRCRDGQQPAPAR